MFKNKTLTALRPFWEHLPPALVIGGAFSLQFDDPRFVIIAIVSGWLVDVDHLFDFLFFCLKSKSQPTLELFSSGRYFKRSNKAYLFFHSYELAVLTLFCGVFVVPGSKYHWMCGGLCLLVHLLQDILTNKTTIIGYSLVYRAHTRFSFTTLCKQKS